MDKLLLLSLLYDFYAELLTEKQKNFFEMYYHNNFSLSEIAQEYDITPQGVRDIIKRTEKILLNYEEKLMLMNKYEKQCSKIQEIFLDIDNLKLNNENVIAIKEKINDILD